MNSEKRQIAAVLKELQKHERQQDVKAQQEELIKAIVETTGKPESLVRDKFWDIQRRRELISEVCIALAAAIGVVVFAIGIALLA